MSTLDRVLGEQETFGPPKDELRPDSSALCDLPAEPDSPLHQRLKTAVEESIGVLQLLHGRRIWTENQLMTRYGVSRHVVRQALSQLVVEGQLISRKGAGHFVNRRRLHKHLPLISSITADLAATGEPYSLQLLDVGLSASDGEFEKILAARSNRLRVYRVRRIGLLDGEPVALVSGAYPTAFAKLLTPRAIRELGVYRTLQQHNLAPFTAEVMLNIDFASADEVKLLGVTDGAALVCIRCKVRTAAGLLIEVTRELYRADRFEFEYAAQIGGNQ